MGWDGQGLGGPVPYTRHLKIFIRAVSWQRLRAGAWEAEVLKCAVEGRAWEAERLQLESPARRRAG